MVVPAVVALQMATQRGEPEPRVGTQVAMVVTAMNEAGEAVERLRLALPGAQGPIKARGATEQRPPFLVHPSLMLVVVEVVGAVHSLVPEPEEPAAEALVVRLVRRVPMQLPIQAVAEVAQEKQMSLAVALVVLELLSCPIQMLTCSPLR